MGKSIAAAFKRTQGRNVWISPFGPKGTLNEEVMLPLLKAGDRETLNAVVLVYTPLFTRMAAKYHSSPVEQGDLVAAVQAKYLEPDAYKNYTPEPGKSLDNWISFGATNAMIDQTRRDSAYRKYHSPMASMLDDDEGRPVEDVFASPLPGPDGVLEFKQTIAPMVEAFNNLPAMQRTVITRRIEGDSVEEIAEELGVDRGTVKTHTSRARQQLAAVLELKGLPNPYKNLLR